MRSLTILDLFLIISLTASKPIEKGYIITGSVTGLDEGSWLYLRTAKSDQDIDSCQVRGGNFEMKGHLNEKAVQVYLHTARYTNYVAFWLENTTVKIHVKAGEFKKGTITGSETEMENRHFEAMTEPLTKKLDSLEKVRELTPDRSARTTLSTEIADLRKKAAQYDRNYVRDHPNSLIAAYLLSVYTSTWGKDTTSLLFRGLSPELKRTAYGKAVSTFISLNRDIRVGSRYVDFRQFNSIGKPIRLSGIKAKYVLLDFWASWCGPCREENPNLVKTYQRFKDKGFEVLAVSLDDNKQRWLKAIKDDHLTWENVSDLQGDQNKAALIYGISGIPDNFLIDDQGNIVARNLRGEHLDKKLLELLP